MPVSSLREGSGEHLASDVNLLTLGAIPLHRPARRRGCRSLLYFRNESDGGLQVGVGSSELPHEESGQMVAHGTGGAPSSQNPWPVRRAGYARLAPRCAGGAGVGSTVGGRRPITDSRAARYGATSGLRLVGPLELHVTAAALSCA